MSEFIWPATVLVLGVLAFIRARQFGAGDQAQVQKLEADLATLKKNYESDINKVTKVVNDVAEVTQSLMPVLPGYASMVKQFEELKGAVEKVNARDATKKMAGVG